MMEEQKMQMVGFEPTPFRNRALIYRLRPLGHIYLATVFLLSPHLSRKRPLIIYLYPYLPYQPFPSFQQYNMRIIKLKIQEPGTRGKSQFSKHAVSLDKKQLRRIGQFISHVRKLFALSRQYGLSLDGFQFSNNQTSQILREDKVYRMSIKWKKVKEQSSSSQSQEIQSSLSELDCSQSSSIQNQASDSSESESSESESIVVVNKRPLKIQQKKAKIQEKKKLNVISSSSSQSSQTPVKKKTVTTKSAPKGQIQAKEKSIQNNRKLSQEGKQKQKQPEKNIVSNSRTKLKFGPKKVIQQSSSQSSDSSLEQIKPKKIVIPKKKQQKIKFSDSESSQTPVVKKSPIVQQPLESQQKKPQIRKLPAAIRNKMSRPTQQPKQPKTYEQHRQSQWIVIDKQHSRKWQQKGHKNICQPPNKVRFKVIQLDQQKFVPVASTWITGQVKQVNQKMVKLINVEQEGKDFMREYQIPQHNMDSLQLWKPLAQKQQLQCFAELSQKQKQPQMEQIKKEVVKGNTNGQSVQKFICGQINYYFSDQNYNTDFFMQLHANTHPQKYINIGLMLNFPKVKKFLRDEDKLIQYLQEDEKYETRNYIVDFQQKLIRKKNILDPSQMHKHHGQEQKAEKEAGEVYNKQEERKEEQND